MSGRALVMSVFVSVVPSGLILSAILVPLLVFYS